MPPAGGAAAASHPLALVALETAIKVNEALATLDFRGAAEASLQLAISANGYLNDQAPWQRMKHDDQRDQVGSDLYAVLEASRWLAVLLAPIVPDLSSRMLVQLGQQPFSSDRPKESGPPSDQPSDQPPGPPPWLAAQQWGVLQPGLALPEPEPVMRRLELDSPL